MNDARSLTAKRTVVFATRNRGKLREMRALLARLPIDLLGLDDVDGQLSIVEDGVTFADNAAIKAFAVADALAMPALGDDSGLEVDALGGRPGVLSARYAGVGVTDADNNRKLLRDLEAVTPPFDGVFRARFVCALCMVDPIDRGHPRASEGRCEGEIVTEARGESGFGYDPIFVPSFAASDRRTFAELTAEEKNAQSHRARAVAAIEPLLAAWLGVATPIR
jgi:XTP/dITP diphosphohydrolase